MEPMGVGIGYRAEISAELLRTPSRIDSVELLFETSVASPRAEREARAVAEVWPTFVHGVKLSLGSADGFDERRAARLGAFARSVDARAISEHAAFVRAGDLEIGHLTKPPFTEEAARVIAKNATRARRHLPDVPFLLENIAWSMRYAEDELDEGAFHSRVLAISGCDLLLDLGNVLANAKNAGIRPTDLLDRYPLERTAQIHIAGGIERDGFYFDTHGHAVGEEVFELLAAALERVGSVPVVLERDEHFGDSIGVLAEVDRAREVVGGYEAGRSRPHIRHEDLMALPADDALARFQDRVARELVCHEPVSTGFDEAGIRRSREILRKKRFEAALVHLPRLSPFAHASHLFEVLRDSPRIGRGSDVADARSIATAASSDPGLGDAARLDLATIEARYVMQRDGSFEPRRGPYLKRQADGSAWIWKGVGARASVRLFPSTSHTTINRQD